MSTQNFGCSTNLGPPKDWNHTLHSTPFQVDMMNTLMFTKRPHKATYGNGASRSRLDIKSFAWARAEVIDREMVCSLCSVITPSVARREASTCGRDVRDVCTRCMHEMYEMYEM